MYIFQPGVKGRKKEAKKQNKKNQHEIERNFDQDIKLFGHFSGD
jgi:hypothetical protein